MTKYHENAITIYGVEQNKEGNSAVKTSAETTGTITVSTASTTVTGVGTAFLDAGTVGDNLGELTIGGYIYNSAGTSIVGRVASITSNTSATLEENSLIDLTAQDFSTGLGPKNCFAVLALTYQTERTTDAFIYTGDELDREERTTETDKYCKLDFSIFMPVLGVLGSSDPVEDTEIPHSCWFKAVRFAVIPSVDGSGSVVVTNDTASVSYLTVEYRQSSPEDPNNQKVYLSNDVRGTLDLEEAISKRGQLKFSLMGNYGGVTDKVQIIPNSAKFVKQKHEIAPIFNKHTITTLQLSQWTGSFQEVAPSYASGTKNVCVDKLNAPNLAAFEFDRILTSCLESWSVGGVPTDLTLTIMENEASATFNPDNHIEDYFSLFVDYSEDGGVTGDVRLSFTKLQLVGVTKTKIGKYYGQDLKFRNIGKTSIALFASVAGVPVSNLKPKYGIGAIILSGNTAGLVTLLSTMTDVPGSSNDSPAGTFTNTTTSGKYGWFAITDTAYNSVGIHIYDGTGYGGWSGAGLSGNNTGASPDPTTLTITATVDGVLWHFFRQDYVNSDPSGGSYTVTAA